MSFRRLLLVGCNLSLLNLLLLRELASLRYCTELVLLSLLAAFFVGQTLGFRFHDSIRYRLPRYLGILLLLLPVLLGLRVASGWSRAVGDEFVFGLLAGVWVVAQVAVYSAILPLTVQQEDGERSLALAKAYSAELAGSLMGLILVWVCREHHWIVLTFGYHLVLLWLLADLRMSRTYLAFALLMSLLSICTFLNLDKPSSEFYYRTAFDYSQEAQILFERSSPYQKVQVIEDEGQKLLYLNGVEYFSPGTLDRFNFYLSELPARLVRPNKVLIIGSGSMSAVKRVEPFVGSVVTVELDPVVVQASTAHFSSEHPSKSLDHKIVIGDARQYLRETDEKFDLIVLDIPTAFTIQTGTLFTRDFFRLAKSKLNTRGVLSIYLTQLMVPRRDQSIAGPILSAIEKEFDDFVLIAAHDVSNSFVMASGNMPFTRDRVDKVLGEQGCFQQTLYESDRARALSKKWEPASLTNLRHVWKHL